jgi:drug/metabolite transporter (DMT)-like permease
LAAGVLFGSTFVVMKDAVDRVAPVPFIAARFLIGAVALAPFALRRRQGPGHVGAARAAFWCGAALLAGYICQTVGLQYTSASVSAFITYLLVVMVPVIAAMTVRRLPTPPTVAGVVLATGGLVLLTGHGVALSKGEAWTLACALAFAVHIVLVSELSPRFDTAVFTAWQLLFVGAGAVVIGAFTGGYDFPASVWLAAYTGLVVTAIAFSLQIWGQRRVGPTRTSLLLMIEPVAAAGFGYAAGDRLGAAAVAGALLILAGIAVAEVPALLTNRSGG